MRSIAVRPVAPFEPWHDHIAIELPGARAVFTTRRGGFSTGPYESLNLGMLTADDRQAVGRNRRLIEERIGRPLSRIRQVHGAYVRRVERPEDPQEPLIEADGQAIASSEIAAMVLTADCLPVAVAGGGAVAMLHAGWRGLAAGILEEGVQAVRELGGGERMEAAIGPGAGPCCYEVGEEVHAHFVYGDGIARRGANLDLKAIARAQLERSGVAAVHDVGVCTICGDPSLFFSHRRDRGLTGRQAGIAWLS